MGRKYETKLGGKRVRSAVGAGTPVTPSTGGKTAQKMRGKSPKGAGGTIKLNARLKSVPTAKPKVAVVAVGRREAVRATGLWVATALAELYKEKYSTAARLTALRNVVDQVLSKTAGPGVITFPGGWFDAEAGSPTTLVRSAAEAIKKHLSELHIQREVVVCVGIDGRGGRDQLGVAIASTGVVAVGRKFYPTDEEEDWIEAAPNWREGEGAFERIFEVAGRRFFISVCYDVFGVKHDELPNPGVHAMLGLIHSFRPHGQGGSGDVLYARHGFAGAAKQWGVPVFGAVKFRDRMIPGTWPSGVVWTLGNASTTHFTYGDNPMQPFDLCETPMPSGRVVTRIFHM